MNKKFWKKYFKVYDILNELLPYKDLLENISNNINYSYSKKRNVLDAGCGTGNFEYHINSLHIDNMFIYGIDYEISGLLKYREKINNANLVLADLTTSIPFQDSFFDVIISNNVLYNIKNKLRKNVIDEFYRVLKPKGVVIISNPKEGWRPSKIYAEHIKNVYKQEGFYTTIINVLHFLIPTIQMFYYNYIIILRNKESNLKFMANEEQLNLLRKVGFAKVSENIMVYSNQSIMNIAIK